MKNVYIVSGTMGVGKTTVCQNLKLVLPNSVFLDGDWCWDSNPFKVTDYTKKMVIDNICYLLNNFIQCNDYENIIFCFVMHEQNIIDSILNNLDLKNCDVKNISLIVNKENLTNRLLKDINNNKRTYDIIDRSIKRIPLYNHLNTYKIDTNDKSIKDICNEIIELNKIEKRDLYDNNKKMIGNTIYKNQTIPNNCYILIVIIFIQNNNNKFLIQKRSKIKGGEWAFTGGHPKSGESSIKGIYSEVKEELGVDINKPILFKEGKGKNSFCDLYYIKQNIKIKNIILQDEEVQEVKYASIEDINNMYNKREFKKGHYIMFMDCLNFLNNGSKITKNNL